MTSDELDDYVYDCDRTAPDSPKGTDFRYVVKLVLRATLYFRAGHTQQIRQALKACFDDYFLAFGEDLRWGWEPQPSGKPTARIFDQNLIDATHNSLNNTKESSNIELAFMSSFNQHYVGDYGIKCLTMPNWEDSMGYDSYLSFWVPCHSYIEGRWDSGNFPIHEFLLTCCKRLKASQGYAGFALSLPHEYAKWEPYELRLAQKYYGLEIDKTAATSLMIDEWRGIKDVNWYTILGEPYTEKLGGSQVIRAKLAAPGFHLYDFGAGIAIRAGAEPEMAPVSKGLPTAYVAVNDVVRSIRTTQIRSMGLGSNAGELRFNSRLTDLWMRRFDAPDIWPPAHQ